MTGKRWKATVGISGIIAISLLTACQRNGQPQNSGSPLTETGEVHSSLEISVRETEVPAETMQENETLPGTETMQTTEQSSVTETVQGTVSQTSGSSYGAGTAGGITVNEAKNKAMEHAGVEKESVQFIQVDTDWDDGVQLYEVEFSADGKEYDYEISAQDGTIVKFSVDSEYENNYPQGNQIEGSANQTGITMDQARKIAADQIGEIDESSIYVKQDYDHGRNIYEGKAYDNGIEYEFEIDGLTGKILEWKTKHSN